MFALSIAKLIVAKLPLLVTMLAEITVAIVPDKTTPFLNDILPDAVLDNSFLAAVAASYAAPAVVLTDSAAVFAVLAVFCATVTASAVP